MKNEPVLDMHTKADQLLDLTRAMLAAAQSDDWDEFELQEQQRSAMLDMIFGNPDDMESAKLHLADAIEQILLIDQEITALISQQRDLASQELRHLKHARQGNKAYQIAADDPL
ncbi:flagellar protein FliT [Methylobacter sp. Wu8]|jgi:hypothetical protein|uniref:flagellar protein FliT n=1 Tax=Methylobacter sp. Wu8 TaxID=3118457 RepID=UPI002F2BB025|nr:flagellar protein FliT [Methylobacter tundripaludum]